MAKVHRVRKGYDLKLIGSPSSILVVAPQPQRVTLYPEDFKNFSPKLSVKEGDRILAGDAVFYAKADPSVLVPSPVSGTVARVVRGEKRVLQFVEIAPDAVKQGHPQFGFKGCQNAAGGGLGHIQIKGRCGQRPMRHGFVKQPDFLKRPRRYL